MAVPQLSDTTIRRHWEGVIDADRLRRYYGYLARRVRFLGDVGRAAPAGFAAPLAGGRGLPPDWIALAAMAMAAAGTRGSDHSLKANVSRENALVSARVETPNT